MHDRIWLPLFLVLASLAASHAAFASDQKAKDQQKCAGYGFQPGTDQFAQCMMKLDEKREKATADSEKDDARMKALSIKRNGDTRFPICSAAMMDANLDTTNNAWYGPNCRQK